MHMFGHLRNRTLVLVAAVSALAALLISCSNSTDMSGHSMDSTSSAPRHSDMTGMDHAPTDGLQASVAGLTLQPRMPTLPTEPGPWTFQIVDASGKPVTEFTPEQTKLMHFYVVRDDLSVFNHLHPTMAADGTWTAELPQLFAGDYRVYTQFTAIGGAGKSVTPVLSIAASVAGTEPAVPLPDPALNVSVDGYALAVDSSALTAGKAGELTVTVSKDGRDVTDLEPYLDSYAHVTAIRAEDMAFAHLHPEGVVNGAHGGPTLTFRAALPSSGLWRVFIQFQTLGTLHTAAITVRV